MGREPDELLHIIFRHTLILEDLIKAGINSFNEVVRPIILVQSFVAFEFTLELVNIAASLKVLVIEIVAVRELADVDLSANQRKQ